MTLSFFLPLLDPLEGLDSLLILEGYISCQSLPTGGSMGCRYVLKLLICEKRKKLTTQQPLNPEKK